MSATDTKPSDSFFPLAGLAQDGWSNDKEATSTCLCGSVQLAFVSIVYFSRIPYHILSHIYKTFKLQNTRLLTSNPSSHPLPPS